MQKLGPYIILGVLGRGGMGSVYKARHEETGEIHALKVLSESMNEEDHFRNRFESEIRALIKLDHPNVVQILSYGQEMGKLYFAMELVNGNSLFQIQKKGYRFDWREVLLIGKQVAAGLRHAHDRGVIHRDLKPGNLLMQIDDSGKHGEVKITDFGIAKSYGISQNTGHNMIGTLDYMSPEQAKGQPVTFRSDLYSLGVVMFALLSGKPPFSGNSFEESIRNLTSVPPPSLSTLVPDVPVELDHLIQKMMAKQPEKRIPTALALIHKLDELESQLVLSSQAVTLETPVEKLNETIEIEVTQGEAGTKLDTDFLDKMPISLKSAKSETTDQSRGLKSKPFQQKETVVSKSPSETAVISSRLSDFYNPVTKHVREQDESDEESHRSKGVIWLLLALSGVIALAVWGYFRATQPKSADELFASISAKEGAPQLVLKEIGQFLTYYSEDERAEQVRQWRQTGEQNKKFGALANRLRTRARINEGKNLSEIERQFVEILNRYEDQKEVAVAKLGALVSVYDGLESLSAEDLVCIEAAKHFQIKFMEEHREELREKVDFIRNAIQLAQEELNPQLSIDRYRSILDLYEGVEWDDSPESQQAKALLRQVQRILDEMRPLNE